MKVKLKSDVTEEQFIKSTFGGKILDGSSEYEIFKNEELTSRIKGEYYEVESPTTSWEYEKEHYELLFQKAG